MSETVPQPPAVDQPEPVAAAPLPVPGLSDRETDINTLMLLARQLKLFAASFPHEVGGEARRVLDAVHAYF